MTDRYMLVRTYIEDDNLCTITEHISDVFLAVRAASCYMLEESCTAVVIFDLVYDYDPRGVILRWSRN